MSNDFTRWNRAGLRRFSYVDGDAAAYLEFLKIALLERFRDAAGTPVWAALASFAPVGSESQAQRLARLLAQYQDERRDYSWEILRTYARSCHILLQHVDSYANECTLPTATRWESLRHLVEMLDYHPSPPASAVTPLVLIAKPGQSGVVGAGFAVKNSPTDGSQPVTFETRAELEVSHELNALRALGFDQSQLPFDYVLESNDVYSAEFPTTQAGDVSVGAVGLLIVESATAPAVHVPVEVAARKQDGLTLKGPPAAGTATLSALRHQVTLLLAPKLRQQPMLFGQNTIVLDSMPGLAVNDLLAWSSGGWAVAEVTVADGARVQLQGGAVPPAGANLYRALRTKATALPSGSRTVVPPISQRLTSTVWTTSFSPFADSLSEVTDAASGQSLYFYTTTANELIYVPKVDTPIAVVAESSPQTLQFAADPRAISGDPVLVLSGGSYHAATIVSVHQVDDGHQLYLSAAFTQVQTLLGNFELVLRPTDHDRNETPVFDVTQRADTHSVIPIHGTVPADARVGRQLLLASPTSALLLRVRDVDFDAGTISVAPAIPGSELTGTGTTLDFARADCVLHGNVVDGSHGETKPEKVLGSGNATQKSQSFDLDVEGLSFAPDINMPAGVAADIELQVDGRVWQQAATLNDHGPEAAVYAVFMRSDGSVRVQFGDGVRGRRLPSGRNNVRLTYRKGAGVMGNLPALSLSKIKKPHPVVDSVLQALPATGGNDMESSESMRVNAPKSALTLQRAVSLSDFKYLAQANSAVWQAAAILKSQGGGRTERIQVIVVPAGGGALAELGPRLQGYLAAHALPGVQIEVVRYQPILLDLDATVRVKVDEYDLDSVKQAVLSAIYTNHGLPKVYLGKAVYQSDLVSTIEGIVGVENCQCRLNPTGFRSDDGSTVTPASVGYGAAGDLRRITPAANQLLVALQGLSNVNLQMVAYLP